ncbi:hypothetical protein BC936DRAFT_143395 [Jimgerdemannia flammicorona]|uniref:Uncharacterized protein n=1 Tax=Jimgerdemannia flammicorona TaxID=994334 RepID=A0A432ZZ17_9FUNG|nr:hypothetical protein BC936DRAFT_143395 [Jimgerdemannia flammicorona]
MDPNHRHLFYGNGLPNGGQEDGVVKLTLNPSATPGVRRISRMPFLDDNSHTKTLVSEFVDAVQKCM